MNSYIDISAFCPRCGWQGDVCVDADAEPPAPLPTCECGKARVQPDPDDDPWGPS